MSLFCLKKLPPSIFLSEQFKKARAEKGLDFFSLSLTTGVPEKYLRALEEHNFSALPPAKAYRLAYVKSYAEALGLPPDKCIRQFKIEDGLKNIPAQHTILSNKKKLNGSIALLLRNISLIIFVIAFAFYFIYQIRGILEPPHLIIFSPDEGYVTEQNNILVRGETDKETKLTVNGQDIMVNEEGKFEVNLDLSKGVNTITISATKKHGKTTSNTRHVVVK